MNSITPQKLASYGTEQAIQSAFFLALRVMAVYGYEAALDEKSYLSKAEAERRTSGPIYDASVMFAIPNGEERHKAVAAKLKAAGVRPGVPDTFLPIARGGYHGLFIEFKRSAKGRLSDPQKAMIASLRARDYRVEIHHDWKSALEAVRNYLQDG